MSADALVRRADTLIAEGQLPDAVDALSEANRIERSTAVEERLSALRRQAFAAAETSTGRTTWPPKFADPFERVDEFAEIGSDELSVETLGGAIHHHGYLIVRNLLPPATVDRLVEVVKQSLAAQNAWHDGAPSSTTSPWFLPEGGLRPDVKPDVSKGLPTDMTRLCVADSPRAMFEVSEAFRQVGIDRLVSDYLGDRPVMMVKKWLLWRMDRKADVFQFHQEASVFNSGQDGRPHPDGQPPRPLRAVNVWIALSHSGLTSPGLQFIPRRMDRIVPPDQLFGLKPDTLVQSVGDVAPAAPIYAPGDAILFDEYLLHRTRSDPSMTDVRYSVEAWMFAPSGFPGRGEAGLLL